MEQCYPRANTSPFVHHASIECSASSSSRCPEPNCKLPSQCYWDEALLECLNDFSGHSRGGMSDFPVNTATTTTSSPPSPDQHYYYHDDDDNNNSDHHHNDAGYGGHAALHYEDVQDAGAPARPQEFPTPYIYEGTRTTIRAMDHRTQQVRVVKNVLLALCNIEGSGKATPVAAAAAPRNVVDRAYLLKKRITKSQYGNRYLSVVLVRRPFDKEQHEEEEDENKLPEEWNVEWESTEEFVVITVSPWNEAMRRHRRSLSQKREGPVHAIAAMQHVGNYHAHVQGLTAVFSDEEHLYIVSPFHGGIDLQTKILINREQGHYKPNEVEARVIFTQLLQGIFHLQRKGVCHSNLSLENVYIDRNNQHLQITDFGRSFRVPYNDPSNFGCLTGEAEGTTRRLLQLLPQDFGNHPTENLMYLPPEVIENEAAFDGFAADLWAAACILFILLVGMAPFKTAHYWDAAYAEISSGNLKGLLASLNIYLSDEATGLLQNMLWRDPRDRLSLAQILDHAWVKNQRFPTKTTTTTTTTSPLMPRNFSTGRLSNADTASTTSSFATEKSDKARLSSGSRKSLSKALTGLFGGSKDTTSKGTWGGLLLSTSSSSRHSSSNGNRRRTSSLGGLSSAASSATTNISPSSLKSVTATEEEEKQDAFGYQVLQLPSL